MRKILLFAILLMCQFGPRVLAQNSIDSLDGIWRNTQLHDTVRLNAITKLTQTSFFFSHPDSALHLGQVEYELAKRNNQKEHMAKAINIIGISYIMRGAYAKALDYLHRSYKLYQETDDTEGLANVLMNIGNVYFKIDDVDKAYEHFSKCLKYNEELGDKPGVAKAWLNLASVHIGRFQPDSALVSLQRAYDLAEELDNEHTMSEALYSMGMVYHNLENIPKAISNYEKSLAIKERLGDRPGFAFGSVTLGMIYGLQKSYKKGIENCEKGLRMARELQDLNTEWRACQCLYDTYKSMGNGTKALEYHELMLALNDSLNAREAVKRLQQMEFANQTLADSLATVEKERLVEEAHQEEVRKKNRTRNIFGGLGFFALLLAGGFYWRWRYIRQSKAVLQVEKDRSENLLLNILPADIAAELKEKGRADARDFDLVSILFTDFKGFTAASEKLSAQELVSEINACFEAFDGIMGKYGIEKIKTIGDAYMAAGGLPVPTEGSVKNTVLAALEMQEFISQRKAKLDAEGKPGFEMRVGIHTGPVVAGIVGVKKFQYDIWGDTVNTASRIESSGEVGKVNISEATYELLKDDAQFRFESRGKIQVKGKGEMDMYFVSKA